MSRISIVLLGMGIFLVAIGCLFLTRKKLIFSNYYYLIFLIGIAFSQNWATSSPYVKVEVCLSLVLVAIFFLLEGGRYTVANVDSEMVKETIISVLEKEQISYHVIDGSKIALDEYQKTIKYICFFHCADINFGKIRTLSVFRTIREEFFRRIKHIEVKVFPSTGVFFIVCGLFMILLAI